MCNTFAILFQIFFLIRCKSARYRSENLVVLRGLNTGRPVICLGFRYYTGDHLCIYTQLQQIGHERAQVLSMCIYSLLPKMHTQKKGHYKRPPIQNRLRGYRNLRP